MTIAAPPLTRFDHDVLLVNGRAVRIRPAVTDDLAAVRAFYDHLSDRAAYQRFMGARPVLHDDQLVPLAGQDPQRRVTLLAVAANPGGHDGADTVIGVGEYWRIPERDEAEVAFAVADDHHGEGVATALLEDLVELARAAGLHRLVAETQATNEGMLRVFRTAGLGIGTWYDTGQVHVELDLTSEPLLQDSSDRRDWIASVTSLQPLLRPDHVVVFGAGRNARSPGRAILANLLDEFSGRVSVVHPDLAEVDGVAAVADVAELDGVPDLAVVAIPARSVVGVVEACGRAGVRAAVIVSSGFAEEGAAGLERERHLVAAARRWGMRIVGPNCLGVVSTGVGLNATFLRRPLRAGHLAIASQSGGVGVAIAEALQDRRLGVSAFVSLGNKPDVSGNDLLRYWADDPETKVALLYLESIGDAHRFARVARAVSPRLPVVALKGGRSAAGRRGAASHTAALAADDAGIDALFAATGVIRVTTLDQLLDVGELLAAQPCPAGRRVALVGNAGGPLILAADAAANRGLDVVELSTRLQGTIRRLAPEAAAVANPVDLLATAPPATVAAVVEAIAATLEVDACIVVDVDLGGVDEARRRIEPPRVDIPVVAVAVGGEQRSSSVPLYPTPERAVDAIGLAAARGAWIAAAADTETVDADREVLAARSLVRQLAAADRDDSWLSPADTFEVLETLGVPVVPWGSARTDDEIVRVADRIGYPCVVKADVAGLVHKSEAGAVALGVASAEAVRGVLDDFRLRFGPALRGAIIQEQAPPGVELLVGAVRDPSTGPLVVVADGGTLTEIHDDRTVALAPLTTEQARHAITRLRIGRLLRGFRGSPPVPVAPIADVVGRVGLLIAGVPEVRELDINPLIATADGVVALDARIAVAPVPTAPLRALRRPAR